MSLTPNMYYTFPIHKLHYNACLFVYLIWWWKLELNIILIFPSFLLVFYFEQPRMTDDDSEEDIEREEKFYLEEKVDSKEKKAHAEESVNMFEKIKVIHHPSFRSLLKEFTIAKCVH